MGNCDACGVSQQQKQEILVTQQQQPTQYIQQTPVIQQSKKEKTVHPKLSMKEEKQIKIIAKQNIVKKRGKAAFMIEDESQQVKDNVIVYERQIDKSDIEQIKKTLKNHFIFSQLPEKEIDFVIKNMRPCSAKKDNYIFKQGDIAGSYYIILEGQCMVEINGNVKKKLVFGDSFGDLGIIYQAPRSASVKAISDCQLVQIGRKSFKKVTDQINAMYQEETKQFLQVLSFYKDLTEEQKNVIASTCLTQTYQQGQVIFNQGDDANSIYIIKKGKVLIKQKNIQIGQRQFFGQNCLLTEKTGLRSNTIVAKTNINMISISRQIIVNSLGDNLRNTLKKNILKKILKQNKIYKPEKAAQWQQSVNQGSIIHFKTGQKVISKGTILKGEMLAVLSAQIKSQSMTYEANSLIESQTLEKQGQYTFTSDFIALRDGQLLRIKIILDKIQQKQEQKQQDREIANIQKKMMISDLYVIRELRGGNFGQVYACYNCQTLKLYAVKVLERSTVEKESLIQYIMNQEEILRTAPKHPFLVKFYKLIKDTNFIYFIMDFIAGEDLFDTMSKIPSFDQKKAKFFGSQILLALQHLHTNRIIYRDLKPQNIMVDKDGYIVLVDMGTAKRLKIEKRYRTKTIIGTPHYMAPEIILGKGYSFQVDLWSFGVLLYELICGKLPFGQLSEDPFTIYQEVMSGTLKYPRSCPKSAKIFIQKLLSKNPQQRMGSGFDEMKKNGFFNGIDWKQIYNKDAKPVYIPDESTSVLKDEIEQIVGYPSNKASEKFMAIKNKRQ